MPYNNSWFLKLVVKKHYIIGLRKKKWHVYSCKGEHSSNYNTMSNASSNAQVCDSLSFQKCDFQYHSLLLPLLFQRLPWYTRKLYKSIICSSHWRQALNIVNIMDILFIINTYASNTTTYRQYKKQQENTRKLLAIITLLICDNNRLHDRGLFFYSILSRPSS